MEALTALSLACNILQLVETAVKAFRTFKELYDSETGQTEKQAGAEAFINNLGEVLTRLEQESLAPSTRIVDAQLQQVIRECRETSLKVLALLKRCQADSAGRLWPSATAAYNLFRKRKEFEALQERLEGHQVQMSRLQASSTYVNVHEILGHWVSIQDSQNSTVKTLRVIEEKLAALSGSPSAEDLADLIDDAKTNLPHLLEHINQQKVLKGLRYDELTKDSRFSHIATAEKLTLNWIFASSPEDVPKVLCKYHTAFLSWLREGSGIYHIEGKPGSGKSTLMKYIVNNEDTRPHLQSWAGTQTLCTASFFFWKPGSTMQNTIRGLVTGLMFDIVKSCPEAVAVAFPNHWQPERLSMDWRSRATTEVFLSYEDIRGGFERLITYEGPRSRKFCFFIDGLDEYDGSEERLSHGQFARQLREWVSASHGNVKLCVASREHPVFDRLSLDNRIRLQDYTYNDIEKVVCDSLNGHRRFRELMSRDELRCKGMLRDIAHRADGVFLWVALLLRSLHTVLDYDCSLSKVLQIVEETPVEMKAFMRAILDNIKPEFRYETHLLLGIILRWHGYLLSGERLKRDSQATSLNSVSVALLLDELDGSSQFLGEIKPASWPDRINQDWLRPREKKLVGHCNGLISCKNSEIQFSHRSVSEFLVESLKRNYQKHNHHITDNDVLQAIYWMFHSYSAFAVSAKHHLSPQPDVGHLHFISLHTLTVMGSKIEPECESWRESTFRHLESLHANLAPLPPLSRTSEHTHENATFGVWWLYAKFPATAPGDRADDAALIEMVTLRGIGMRYLEWRLGNRAPLSRLELDRALLMTVIGICSRDAVMSFPFPGGQVFHRDKDDPGIRILEAVLARGASANVSIRKGGNLWPSGTSGFAWHLLLVKVTNQWLGGSGGTNAWEALELFLEDGAAAAAIDLNLGIESPPRPTRTHGRYVRTTSLCLSYIGADGLPSSSRSILERFSGQKSESDFQKGLEREARNLQHRLPPHEDGTLRTGIQGWKLRDFISHVQPRNMDNLLAILDKAEDERWERIYGEAAREREEREAEEEKNRETQFLREDTPWLSAIFVAMFSLWVAVLLQEYGLEGF